MGLIKAPHQFETSAETPHGLAPSATSAANCSLIHRKAKCLFIQARGVLKTELLEHLRAKRTIRRSRHASLKRNGLGQIKDAVSISERPASVEDRAVPGHWEGDLIGGAKNSYVATLVERHSRYVMLIKVANKDTQSVVTALTKQSRRLPGELYQSLTWDRGKELAAHKRLALEANVEIYFCDP